MDAPQAIDLLGPKVMSEAIESKLAKRKQGYTANVVQFNTLGVDSWSCAAREGAEALFSPKYGSPSRSERGRRRDRQLAIRGINISSM